MHAFRDRLTYANVMATIAVFIALGGTSIAASQLGRNTVGSKQIINESIASGDITRGGVRSSDIHNGTITHKDVRNGTLRGRDVATNTIGTRNLEDSGISSDDLDRNSVTGRAIHDGTITARDLAAGALPELQNLTKDGPANVPSLRTLGSGANQAAAGDDPRLSDARPPTGAAGGDLTGTYPNPGLDADSVDSGTVENGTLRLADYAAVNSNGSFTGGTAEANDCANAIATVGGLQAGDRVFFMFPADVTSSLIIPPMVWTGGGSAPIQVCNMNNVDVTLPNTTLTAIALR